MRVSEGDIVMFPRGDAHVMSSAPGMRSLGEDSEWRVTTRDAPKPIAVAYHDGVCDPGAELPADGAATVFICGFISCDLRPFNPLDPCAAPGDAPEGQRRRCLGLADAQAASESRQRRPGSAALLEQVSEMVFVDAARRHLESLPEGGSGWLAALRDRRHAGRAIGLLHEQPAQHWTIDELGRQVGLSRSTLHERFVQLLGQPPMQYLANWRMQLGAKALRESRATVATVAQDVGYESEAAFARAFKRLMGQPPAAWRRAQR